MKKSISVFSLLPVLSVFISGNLTAQDSTGAAGTTVRPVVKSKPVPLDWKAINWPSLDYTRSPIDGGASLYTLPSSSAKKFRIDVLFEGGVYSTARENRPALGAAVDLLMQGGIGNMSFEALQKYTNDNGIKLNGRVSRTGYIHFTAEALAPDFQITLKLLNDLLLSPKWEPNALELWKQERTDDFDSLLDGSNSRKQNQFIEQEAIKLAFGENHYFATSLKRASKKTIAGLKYSAIKEQAKRFINRTGMNVVLSGTFSKENQTSLAKFLNTIPRQNPSTFAWLPGRTSAQPSKKLRIAIIRKPDMSQANITFRYIFPNSGRLNRLERTRFSLLSEIFSATGGVVGNDRFSKAMRADSGISYSPHASYDPEAIEPNTSVGSWKMSYQSPNERILESVNIARKTFEDFAKKGITAEEAENARISRMNQTLAIEETIFDKTDDFIDDIFAKFAPNPIAHELSLARLDQERSVDDINESLNTLMTHESIPIMVIMGNPSAETIENLSDLPNTTVAKVVNFSALVKDLQ